MVATDAPVILRHNGVVRVPDDENRAVVFMQPPLAVSLDYYYSGVGDVFSVESGFSQSGIVIDTARVYSCEEVVNPSTI